MRGEPAYMRTREERARGWSAIAAPTATHQGRKRMTRKTREKVRESPGGAQGDPGGGARVRSVAVAAGTGLAGADGSVSVSHVLRLRTICCAQV